MFINFTERDISFMDFILILDSVCILQYIFNFNSAFIMFVYVYILRRLCIIFTNVYKHTSTYIYCRSVYKCINHTRTHIHTFNDYNIPTPFTVWLTFWSVILKPSIRRTNLISYKDLCTPQRVPFYNFPLHYINFISKSPMFKNTRNWQLPKI